MTHPHPDELTAFLLGHAVDAAVEAHVDSCRDCQQSLSAQSEDDALTRLVAAGLSRLAEPDPPQHGRFRRWFRRG